jgi:hypothetical protein
LRGKSIGPEILIQFRDRFLTHLQQGFPDSEPTEVMKRYAEIGHAFKENPVETALWAIEQQTGIGIGGRKKKETKIAGRKIGQCECAA